MLLLLLLYLLLLLLFNQSINSYSWVASGKSPSNHTAGKPGTTASPNIQPLQQSHINPASSADVPYQPSQLTFHPSTWRRRPRPVVGLVKRRRTLATLVANYSAIVWIGCDTIAHQNTSGFIFALDYSRCSPLLSAALRCSPPDPSQPQQMTTSVFACFHKSHLTRSAAGGSMELHSAHDLMTVIWRSEDSV